MATRGKRKRQQIAPVAASAGHGSYRSIVHNMLVALLFTVSLGFGGICKAEPSASKEYKLKAAFVYNFCKFIEWPGRAFTDNTAPIVIGVFGSDLFSQIVEETVKNRQVNGRNIVVKPLQSPAAAKSTHLLFISASEDAHVKELIDALQGYPVLSVGESEAFAQQRGMICFVLEGDKLRFKINMASANQAGLKISAQLQKLATSVRQGP